MHYINFSHRHELEDQDFSGCCKDCQGSVNIIKPHILGFAKKIKKYTREMLAELDPEDLYRLYQIIDDIAHMDAGPHLAGLILNEPDIQRELPLIRTYYSEFFNIHETHLAQQLFKSDSPWKTLKSFPFYPRYKILVETQFKVLPANPDTVLAFVGSGPVPMSLIIAARLYGVKSIGIDNCAETVKLSKKVIQCLKLENMINIIHGDHFFLEKLNWDIVLVAALAEPKASILKTILKILKNSKKELHVIFRTYTGIKEILYKPIQPGDIAGFRITKEILPIGRVNNTTVFAELDR